jgi:hypothetical protein
MRLIRFLAARVCLRVGIWLAVFGQWPNRPLNKGDGPSSLKAEAVNFTSGRGWGLNIPEGRVSLPLVCESLRTRKRRKTGARRHAILATAYGYLRVNLCRLIPSERRAREAAQAYGGLGVL